MSAVPRLQDVLQTMQAAITAALNAAEVVAPAQVALGWPIETQLEPILASGGYMVTLYPRLNTARSAMKYSVPDSLFLITDPTSTLVATTTIDSITFSGVVSASENIHTICGADVQDAFYQTLETDTLDSVAAAVAAAVNALENDVTATVAGAVVTLGGTPFFSCTVGGSNGAMAQEIQRVERSIQVSIWSANPQIRFQASDAIMGALGAHDDPILTLSDGSPVLCLFSAAHSADNFSDQSDVLAGIYEEHLVFDVEYGILKIFPSVTIGAVENVLTLDDDEPITLLTGGS